MNNNLLDVSLDREGQLTRRRLLQLGGTGFAGLSATGILRRLGLRADEIKRQGRACIMVFLTGAPSQMETWDPKPGTDNGGPTKSIDTTIPGVAFAEYWPKLAQMASELGVIRTVAGKEAAHERGRYHLRTGRRLTGTANHPHFGSVVARTLGDPDAEIPNFVSMGSTISSGFLGVQVAPFVLDKAGELPANVSTKLSDAQFARRLALLRQQDGEFASAGAESLAHEHQELYAKAARIMTSSRLKAFQLSDEPDKLKEAYGRHAFGQGCLVARRLVEAGVPFIEVQRGGWDMHNSLWQNMPKTASEVDQGVSQLLKDLNSRGLLSRTLVLVLGEFREDAEDQSAHAGGGTRSLGSQLQHAPGRGRHSGRTLHRPDQQRWHGDYRSPGRGRRSVSDDVYMPGNRRRRRADHARRPPLTDCGCWFTHQ